MQTQRHGTEAPRSCSDAGFSMIATALSMAATAILVVLLLTTTTTPTHHQEHKPPLQLLLC